MKSSETMRAVLAGVVLLGVLGIAQANRNVTIVALFDSEDEVMIQVFVHAIQRINTDRWNFPKIQLFPQIEVIRKDDSFQASKRLCSHLLKGVGGVFGPMSMKTSSHVQSICGTVQVPHVEVRWDYRSFKDDISVNLYPHPSSLSQAYVDIVHWWDWKHTFTIIYEDAEGLARLQGLLKIAETHELVVRQLGEGDEYRPLLKEIKKSSARHIVLDCSVEKIYPVLKQAQQIGLMNDYYDFLITNLDVHTVKVDDFLHSLTNITGIQLVDVTRPEVRGVISDWRYAEMHGKKMDIGDFELKTETALMYDAVHMFAKAVADLESSQRIDIRPLSCESDAAWYQGKKVIEKMKELEKPGLSGSVRFDQHGFRTDFELDIIRMNPDVVWKKLASWNIKTQITNTISAGDLERDTMASRQNKTLIITTIFSEPYFMNKSNSDKLEGNDRYEGYVMDLMEAIAKEIKINYQFQPVKDKSYGGVDKVTGKWNGMVGALVERNADLAIADLTITRARESAVDFTVPFMELGIAILFKKPIKEPPDLLSFLAPFKTEVWIYMATAYLGVSIVMFILSRFTPYEWDNPHPCNPDPDELENQFGLLNCMWFAIGSLMQQGCDFLPKLSPYEWDSAHPCNQEPEELENTFDLLNSMWFNIGSLMQQGSDLAPKAISTRTVASIWWFFTLIMISSYTANLAAFLTQERMGETIDGAEDLAKQHKVKYGCVDGGSTANFFKNSKVDTFKKMWTFMQSDQSVYSKSNTEGVQRVKKGDYAFLMESSSIEYKVERECDLMKVGQHLDNKGYGIATPKGSPYWTDFNRVVLKLAEDTTLTRLKQKWWKERGGGKCDADASSSDDASSAALQLANVGGVFVVLMAGTGAAMIIGVIEFVWNTRKTVHEERTSVCQEMAKELKFVFSCSGTNTKPVPKPPAEPENPVLMALTGYNSKDALS